VVVQVIPGKWLSIFPATHANEAIFAGEVNSLPGSVRDSNRVQRGIRLLRAAISYIIKDGAAYWRQEICATACCTSSSAGRRYSEAGSASRLPS